MNRRTLLTAALGGVFGTGCLRLTGDGTATSAGREAAAGTRSTAETPTSSPSPEAATSVSREWQRGVGAASVVRNGSTLYALGDEALVTFDLKAAVRTRTLDLPDFSPSHLVVENGMAYCAGEDYESKEGPLFAVDLDGGRKWTYRGPYRGIESKPWVVDGTIAVGSATTDASESKSGSQNRSETVLLDAATGDVEWTVPSDQMNESRFVDGLAFDGRTLVVFADSTHLFDVPNRAHVGTADIGCGYASPVLADGYLYAGGRKVAKFDLDARSRVWTSDSPSPSRAPPALTSETLLVATDRGVGSFARDDGTRNWFTPTLNMVRTSPVVAFGRVWAGDDNGNIYGFDPETGKQVVKKSLADDGRLGSLFAYEGALYAGTSRSLWKLQVS